MENKSMAIPDEASAKGAELLNREIPDLCEKVGTPTFWLLAGLVGSASDLLAENKALWAERDRQANETTSVNGTLAREAVEVILDFFELSTYPGQIQECENRVWDILDGHSRQSVASHESPWRDYFKAAMGLFSGAASAREAAEAELSRLRELLPTFAEHIAAARDVLAAFGKQAGVVPHQNGYSTTMTPIEMDVANAVAELDKLHLMTAEMAALPSPPVAEREKEK